MHNDPTWAYYERKTAAYGPSKTALNAYTIALAFELKDTRFKVNAVDPGFTKTDFNQHRGKNSAELAASYIVKYATLDDNGPSGKFASYDNDPTSGISPW